MSLQIFDLREKLTIFKAKPTLESSFMRANKLATRDAFVTRKAVNLDDKKGQKNIMFVTGQKESIDILQKQLPNV